MRASRLLSMMILLQMRGRVSARELAAEFEVSVRTIYRDADHLSAAGVPIYAETGRHGGFSLHDGFRTRLTGLTPPEAEALMLAGMGDAAADLGLGPAAATAQLKLLASLPADAGATAQRVAQRFHLDPIAWYGRAETNDHLPTLAAAVWREQRLRFGYSSWTADVTRVVDPLGLVLKGGVWYLVGAVEGDVRTYRVSNIRAVEDLGVGIARPRGFNLDRYWQEWSRAFERRLLGETARVRLSPAGLRLLQDVSPAAAEAARTGAIPSGPDDWVEAVIPVETISSAARQLLRLGSDLEVLEPAALRAALAEEARRIVELYDPPPDLHAPANRLQIGE